MCVQLWRKYLTNTKISFVENDADCAKKHKAEIEAVAKGKVYVGEPPRLTWLHLTGPYKSAPEDLASAWLRVLELCWCLLCTCDRLQTCSLCGTLPLVLESWSWAECMMLVEVQSRPQEGPQRPGV